MGNTDIAILANVFIQWLVEVDHNLTTKTSISHGEYISLFYFITGSYAPLA